MTLTPITDINQLNPGIRVLFNWDIPMACVIHGRYFYENDIFEHWRFSTSGKEGVETFECPDATLRADIELGNAYKIDSRAL